MLKNMKIWVGRFYGSYRIYVFYVFYVIYVIYVIYVFLGGEIVGCGVAIFANLFITLHIGCARAFYYILYRMRPAGR